MNQDTYTHDVPPIPDHAIEQWAKRTAADIPLGQAWKESFEVDAPEVDGKPYLYAPYDILIVKRAGVLKTVLHAQHWRMSTQACTKCEACDLLHPVLDEACRWCGHESDTVSLGNMTIHRRDGS